MEAILVPYSADQSFSPYKHIKNPKRSYSNARNFTSKSSENFAPPPNTFFQKNGLLFTPRPSLSFSFPSSSAYINQPPLLPIPITKPYTSLPSQSRSFSSCPIPSNKKPNRSPKKSKSPPSTSPKKGDLKQNLKSKTTTKEESGFLMTATTSRLGPDPNDLPRDVSNFKVLSSSVNSAITSTVLGGDDGLEKFSASVFTLSPHPSSLPLPKFSLRPKVSCKAKASSGGIDAGATDSLRRLLRLR